MKKIIIVPLMLLSAIVFAKTEEPKTKVDILKKEEKVLVPKKTLRDEKTIQKITIKKDELDPHTSCVLGFAFFVMSHGGNFLEGAAIGNAICP